MYYTLNTLKILSVIIFTDLMSDLSPIIQMDMAGVGVEITQNLGQLLPDVG